MIGIEIIFFRQIPSSVAEVIKNISAKINFLLFKFSWETNGFFFNGILDE
jgi:hypothetical protein